jgi:hypothetical protein
MLAIREKKQISKNKMMEQTGIKMKVLSCVKKVPVSRACHATKCFSFILFLFFRHRPV